MSITSPMIKMKKFFKNKDKVVDTLVEFKRSASKESRFTMYRPQKQSLVYFGIDSGIDAMTFCIELEYKNVLLMFFYEPIDKETVEYSFAFKWSEDEVEEGTDVFHLHPNITESEFFQQSLIDDFQFLTLDLHLELLRYCQEVELDVRTRIENNNSN